MNMIKVTSSSITAIGYDESSHKMNIKFINNSTTYTYCNVPSDVFQEFLNNPYKNSHGKHYYKFIFKKYNCY